VIRAARDAVPRAPWQRTVGPLHSRCIIAQVRRRRACRQTCAMMAAVRRRHPALAGRVRRRKCLRRRHGTKPSPWPGCVRTSHGIRTWPPSSTKPATPVGNRSSSLSAGRSLTTCCSPCRPARRCSGERRRHQEVCRPGRVHPFAWRRSPEARQRPGRTLSLPQGQQTFPRRHAVETSLALPGLRQGRECHRFRHARRRSGLQGRGCEVRAHQRNRP